MTEKRFKPYNKTVKQWIEWLSQFDDDCKVETILKKGDATFIHLDGWTTGLSLYLEVKE